MVIDKAKIKIGNNNNTKDSDIRDPLLRTLRKDYQKVISEFTIDNGEGRADIVAIDNSSFCAYEIKSDRDTLCRLHDQIQSYNKIFDNVTLVVGEHHLIGSLAIIPDWWGVILVKQSDKKIKMYKVRDSLMNPSREPMSILNLLHKNELIFAFSDKLKGRTHHTPKSTICAKLNADSSRSLIYERVRKTILSRQAL